MIFVNRFFYPDHSATSQMLGDLAFALAERGRKVTIITSRQRYDDPHARLPARETVDGVEIRRVWTSQFGRRNLIGRAVDYLSFYASAALELGKVAGRGDVIVAKTDPPMLSIVAAPIARLKGARLVNWLQDIFPEVASELGVGRGRLPEMLYGVLTRLRNLSLRRSAMTVAIGERMAERVAAAGVPSARIRVVENWADGAVIHPVAAADNPLRAEWGLGDALVVGYSGNLGRAHDPHTMLDAIVRLEAEPGPCPVVWLFIGDGPHYDVLRRAIAERGLRSVQFRPYQPRHLLAQSLSLPDVHLVSLRPRLEGLIVPSKFYGVAAAGRPTLFIGDADGEIARTLNRHGCGLCVAEGDGAGLAAALRRLAADAEFRARMGERGRQAFLMHFDKSAAVARWDALLAEVQASRP